jgi:hypothetical protein
MRKTVIAAITALSLTSVSAWADVQSEVAETINATADAWNSQVHSNVLKLWDKDNETPYYLAEERDEWLVGWDELNGYLNPPRQSPVIQGMREEMSNIRVNQIAEDLAFAVWDMHFEMKMIGRPAIGENVRVTAILRKKPEGWRYIQWTEAPMTAGMYLDKLMQEDVDHDKFNAAMANKNKQQTN